MTRKKTGFTVVELVLTVVVIGIIAGITAKILVEGLEIYTFVKNRQDATQSARVGMERVINQLVLVRWGTHPQPYTLISAINLVSGKIGFVDETGEYSGFECVPRTVGAVTGNWLVEGTRYGSPPTLHNEELASRCNTIKFHFHKEDGSDVVWWFYDIKQIIIELDMAAPGGYGKIQLKTALYPRFNFFRSTMTGF